VTVGLVMIVRDAADTIGRCLTSAQGLATTATIVDTGSVDDTVERIRSVWPEANVIERPWVGMRENRTEAAALARDTADWLLQVDADMTVHIDAELPSWLAADPDPDAQAWMVEVLHRDLSWRMPFLFRGHRDWDYEGPTHAVLSGPGKRRPLRGIVIRHHGTFKTEKFENDIELLTPLAEAGDPRSTYYLAMALNAVGRRAEAIVMYRKRARMGGYEEEAWHARYQAALLAEDVTGLIQAYQARPWRHEPLSAAARLVHARGHGEDALFIERGGS
jgi:glycosyltransferase involved in cell wall biosynthesis